jgi:hypothetical protein
MRRSRVWFVVAAVLAVAWLVFVIAQTWATGDGSPTLEGSVDGSSAGP